MSRENRRGLPTPSLRHQVRRLPLWAQLSTVVAAGLTVGIVATIAVVGLRSDDADPATSPQQSVIPDIPGSLVDDGRVMNKTFSEHFDASKVEPEVPGRARASAPWAVIEARPDAADISIAYVAGSTVDECQPHRGVEVTETSTGVTIAVVNDRAPGGVSCTKNVSVKVGTVKLDQPLGTRTLFHGPLTAPWDSQPSPLVTVNPGATVATIGAMSCTDLLNPGVVERAAPDYRVEGGNGDGEYAKIALDEMADAAAEATGISTFLQYGGIGCRWGVAHGDSSVSYGFGPISADQAQVRKDVLIGQGFEAVAGAPYVRFESMGAAAGGPAYAFGEGYWAYRFDNGTPGDTDVLDMIVANSPDPGAFGTEALLPDAPSGEVVRPTAPPQSPEQKKSTVTTAGYGKLELGLPVPVSTSLVTWYRDQCGDGRWSTPGTTPESDPISVRTEDGEKGGAITGITLRAPGVKTKSGGEVGMTEAEVTEMFPTAQGTAIDDETSTYVVANDLGQVVFELSYEGEVAFIHVIPADVDVFTVGADDGFGDCPDA